MKHLPSDLNLINRRNNSSCSAHKNLHQISLFISFKKSLFFHQSRGFERPDVIRRGSLQPPRPLPRPRRHRHRRRRQHRHRGGGGGHQGSGGRIGSGGWPAPAPQGLGICHQLSSQSVFSSRVHTSPVSSHPSSLQQSRHIFHDGDFLLQIPDAIV